MPDPGQESGVRFYPRLQSRASVDPERVRDREPKPILCQPDAAGFVLAGGQSIRMGQDKALMLFAGEPLVVCALNVLRDAGISASIAGASSSLAEFATVVGDPEPGHGPLAGICSALVSTAARYSVFLPVDLPLLPPSLISFLLQHARITGSAVTIPRVSGFSQTFPAVLDRAVLPVLKAEFDARRGGCFSAFQAAAASLGQTIVAPDVELLAQSGRVTHLLGLPPFRWFLNVNNPADLARAEALATRRIA